MRRVAAACVVLVLAGSASADPTVQSGAQTAPPVSASPPVLDQKLDGRRSVRGCAVGEDCMRPADVLREFELETLPPPGGSPWLDDRAPARSRLEPEPQRTVRKPSELRPDAPWLDHLELPDLPVRWSQRLADYLVFYRDDPRGRRIMQGWLFAQGKYRELILSYLRKAKLPEDLLYVAMIESSYDVDTLSRAGALGLWQWMPEGAKIYGLRRDRWVDERRDPYRSTIAQMDYFRDLYQRFGDWHIALAAFNVGYGAVLRSIARYNTNDYYQLCAYENALPWENCWYTPKVLATAIVGKNRAAFGFDKVKPAPAEAWDEVAVPASLSFAVLARAAGVTELEIKRLNPHLQKGRTPPGETGYIVRVPTGKKADTQRRIVELQTEWDGHDAYVVAHGERFEDIATTYGLSTYALKRLNNVTHESEISGGTVMVVPRVSAEQRAKNRTKAKQKLHTSGVDQRDGEALIVPVPDKDAVVAGKQRVFYRVVTGDTLKTVAKAFRVSVRDLATWNAIAADANVHPKMVLVAWVPTTFDASKQKVALLDQSQLVIVTRGSAEHLDLQEARAGRVRVEYVAKAKEKLEDIAKKYGMGPRDLARINRISHDTVLAKGDKIIVYVVADPKRSERAEEQWKKTPKSRRGKIRISEGDDESDDQDDEDKDDKHAAKRNKSDDKAEPSDKARETDTSDTSARSSKVDPSSSADQSVTKPANKRTKRIADPGPVTDPTQVD